MASYEFRGRVALVTGAASGMGHATAVAFAAAGAAVAAVDVDEDGLDRVCAEISDGGGEALGLAADVADEADVKRCVGAAVEAFGALDFAFNNAAIAGERGTVATYASADWERVIDVDLRGVWLCMKYELQQMQEQGRGSIVNTSSTAGTHAEPRMPAYTAAKHGVVGLTRNGAVEAAPYGVRVNVVCPGAIDTPMLREGIEARPEAEGELIARTPLGRIGTPEEIAAAVLWLASDAASFVTGQLLYVDGGYTLM